MTSSEHEQPIKRFTTDLKVLMFLCGLCVFTSFAISRCPIIKKQLHPLHALNHETLEDLHAY